MKNQKKPFKNPIPETSATIYDNLPLFDEEAPGFYRLEAVLPDILPVGRSTFYNGRNLGIFPMPINMGSRIALYPRSLIHKAANDIARGKINLDRIASAGSKNQSK